MIKKNPLWLVFSLLVIVTLSCSIPSLGLQSSTATPTPGLKAGGIVVGANSGAAGGAAGSNTATNNPTPTSTKTPTPTITPTPTPTPNPTSVPGGPYVVSQIVTLGDETVSGIVCSVTQPFFVTSTTPNVTFNMNFFPDSADHGTLLYKYSVASAGETHDATGTYTISTPAADGTLLLTMKVSDHVVFKGFDGNVPINYKFNLVPTTGINCPITP